MNARKVVDESRVSELDEGGSCKEGALMQGGVPMQGRVSECYEGG